MKANILKDPEVRLTVNVYVLVEVVQLAIVTLSVLLIVDTSIMEVTAKLNLSLLWTIIEVDPGLITALDSN